MHGNTDHRHGKDSRAHTRQMSRHAGSCDDYLKALFLCAFRVCEEYVRLPVGADNGHLIGYAQFLQYVRRFCHDRHVGIASHHYAHLRRTCLCHLLAAWYLSHKCLLMCFCFFIIHCFSACLPGRFLFSSLLKNILPCNHYFSKTLLIIPGFLPHIPVTRYSPMPPGSGKSPGNSL